MQPGNVTPVPEDLRRLAAAHGVATPYRNERREELRADPRVTEIAAAFANPLTTVVR